MTERFLAAALGGDLDALLRILAPDVTLWADGGGKGPAWSPRPVRGRDARALGVRHRTVNGEPAAVLSLGGSPFAVFVLDLTSAGQVGGIYSVTDPDKLARAR